MRFIREEQFIEKVLNSKIPVLVAFWSNECMACELATRNMVELEEAYGQILFFRFDVKERQSNTIVEKYKVKSIPSFLMFKNSEMVEGQHGYDGIMKLERMIRRNL